MRTHLIWVIALFHVALGAKCPNYFNGDNCDQIECLNGGYKKEGATICTCPPGYLGIHCEAVKTSMPPDNHFKAIGTSFNVINVNFHTQFWGVKTYSNVRQGLTDHFTAFPNGYDAYNLAETDPASKPYLGPVDDVVNEVKFISSSDTKNFKLSDSSDAGLYWCYTVPIYTQLVQMIQTRNLRNTVVTIITEHPPSADGFERAREITVSFGVRVNVFWLEDATYSRCDSEVVAAFKAFVDITGGLFVKLHAEDGDVPTRQLVAQVLLTHYKPQYVSIQSFSDCTAGKVLPVVVDPNVDGEYSFVLLGDTASPSIDSYLNCALRSPLRSADKQLAIFLSSDPQCTSLTVTANGTCTAIVFTNAAAEGPLNLAVYTNYVEDVHTIDTSRYAILEHVGFFPAFHVEAPSSAVTVNSVAASFDSSWTPTLVNRSPAAYEWAPSMPIQCDASQTYSLFLNITVGGSNVQRAVRVACVPTPIATTTSPTTSVSTSVASSEASSSEPTTVLTSTATDLGSTTTGTLDQCDTGENDAGFLFAYATDFDADTWSLVQNTIIQVIVANQNNYTTLADVRIDTAAPVTIDYTTNAHDFSLACQKFAPDAGLALDQLKASNGLDAIRNFLSNFDGKKGLEDSMLVVLVNRLPKSTDDLTDDEYDRLTNMNVKVFALITISSLAEESTVGGRSGAVYNRLAAQTNGHYIVANHTIGRDVNSDYNKIVSSLMQSAYSKNLLFTRNIGVNRLGNNIGTVRIPTKPSGKVNVVITVTLSAVDGNAPQQPNRLFLGIKPNGNNTQTVSIDFLASDTVTRYPNSNFYTTTIDLEAGVDRDLFLIYTPGADQSDLLIRMWIDNNAYHHVGYVGFDELNGFNELKKVDEFVGAALRVKIYNDCYDNQAATLLITDCNGEVSSKYDAEQRILSTVTFDDEGSYPHFPFVPFFCDSLPATPTCATGAASKYDVQFVTDGFSISRSFQCRPGVGDRNPNCLLQDANGNYQCSGAAPFKRGPTGFLNDCSNHGRLLFDNSGDVSDGPTYSCACDPGYTSLSCESVTCDSPNADPLAIDNAYHTYTVVLGVSTEHNPFDALPDAEEFFGLRGIDSLDNIWKYQLISYCADGRVNMVYSGSDLKLFKGAFDSTISCNAQGTPGAIDLTTVYQTAVQGLGRNVKGIIVYFSEQSDLLNVTLDEFVHASQAYQQQVFLFTADEVTPPDIVRIDDKFAQAAMSTGGFLVQSNIDNNVNLDKTFIENLIQSSSSIAIYSPSQSASFSFSTEKTGTKAYLLTWKIANELTTANTDLLRTCVLADDTSISCLLTEATSYTVQVSNLANGPFYAAVYILDDVAPKAQIVSDLARDASNAVSTSTSDTRTMLSIYVPDGYTIVGNDGDGGVTRNAQRDACTFQWTAYSVFLTQKYSTGANVAQITLQKTGGGDKYTRYFAFGTTAAPVCKNGGTPNQSTGSCACTAGFQGADCSLVDCLQNSLSNAWSDVCVCTSIDDVACANQYAPALFM